MAKQYVYTVRFIAQEPLTMVAQQIQDLAFDLESIERVPHYPLPEDGMHPVPEPVTEVRKAQAGPSTTAVDDQFAPDPEAQAAPVPADDEPELDADGLPWDERIHASTKAKNGDGTWRKKRGVDPDTVTDVEAEIRPAEAEEEPQAAVDADFAKAEDPAPATKDEVKVAITRLTEERDLETAINLLQEFEASKLSDLTEGQYGGVVARIEQMLEDD